MRGEAKAIKPPTRHVHAIREKVSGIRKKNHKTALNLRIPPNIRKLKKKRRAHTREHANHQTPKEDEQENTRTLKEAQEPHIGPRPMLVPLRRLEDDDGNSIVEDRLAKDDGVELGIDLVRVEDGEDGHGIGGRERGAHGYGVDEAQVDGSGEEREEPDQEADHDGREERAGEGKG